MTAWACLFNTRSTASPWQPGVLSLRVQAATSCCRSGIKGTCAETPALNKGHSRNGAGPPHPHLTPIPTSTLQGGGSSCTPPLPGPETMQQTTGVAKGVRLFCISPQGTGLGRGLCSLGGSVCRENHWCAWLLINLLMSNMKDQGCPLSIAGRQGPGARARCSDHQSRSVASGRQRQVPRPSGATRQARLPRPGKGSRSLGRRRGFPSGPCGESRQEAGSVWGGCAWASMEELYGLSGSFKPSTPTGLASAVPRSWSSGRKSRAWERERTFLPGAAPPSLPFLSVCGPGGGGGHQAAC